MGLDRGVAAAPSRVQRVGAGAGSGPDRHQHRVVEIQHDVRVIALASRFRVGGLDFEGLSSGVLVLHTDQPQPQRAEVFAAEIDALDYIGEGVAWAVGSCC